MKKKSFKKVILVSSLCLFIVLLATWPSTIYAAQQDVIKLTYSIFWPSEHYQTQVATNWAKEIEKRTNGRVKIVLYPAETLTPAAQTYDGVVKGISDIGQSCLSYTTGRFPVLESIDLPVQFRSSKQGSRVAWEVYKKFRPKEFNDTKLLFAFTSSPGLFQTRKPIRSLEDIKGMRIRCTGGNAPMVKALEAVPVAIPMPETYFALQRGVCDGTLCPFESLKGFRLGEVIKYTTEFYVYVTSFFVSMNLDKWKTLPTDVQRVFEDVSEQWVDITGKAWDDADEVGKKYSLGLGNKIVTLQKGQQAIWTQRFRPIIDKYTTNLEAKGLPGKAVVDYIFELKGKYNF